MYASKKNTQNGIVPIGSNLFGTCASSESATTKIVTMTDFDVLVDGVTIHVYFTYGNTASSFSLKVGSTNAMSAEGSWGAGEVASFTYHNSRWLQNDGGGSGVTYTMSINGQDITLTGSDGSTQTITVPKLMYTEDAPDGTTTNNVVQNDVSGNTATGGYSLAEGYQTTSSGYASHAEGRETTASGNHSHAEGLDNQSIGGASHTEGSHNYARGGNAHAEGFYTEANGERSHTGGHGTIADSQNQVAIGRFNVSDPNDKYYFIVGNGTDFNARSNALGITTAGDVEMYYNTNASTISGALYNAIDALGWTSEVIV